MNTCDDERWLRVGLRSFAQKFTDETRMVWGVNYPPATKQKYDDTFGPWPDADHERIVERYVECEGPDRKPTLKISVYLDFEHRFMAKVALGMGLKLLGDDYLDSPWAKHLRDTLWAQGVEQEKLAPVGAGALGGSPPRTPVTWPGGIAIGLVEVFDRLVLLFDVYGASYSVVVSDEPERWRNDTRVRDGLVWVLIPQREFIVGPLSLGEFACHVGGARPIPALMQAETWRLSSEAIRALRGVA
jgi:hypothetical protein